jgi:Arrestin (or S-antigen), N-terminal domain
MIKLFGTGSFRITETGLFIKHDFYVDEDVLDEKQYALGSAQDCFEIEPGMTSYNFAFTLPSNIPASAHHKKGGIEYCIQALVVCHGLQLFPLSSIEHFIIFRRDDYSEQFPALSLPIEDERTMTFTSICGSQDGEPIVFKVKLPKSTYRKSEQIPIKVQIVNNFTSEKIKSRFQLIQKTQISTIPGKTMICWSARFKKITSKLKMNLCQDVMTMKLSLMKNY